MTSSGETDLRDVITAGGGDDIVCGRGGDDFIDGEAGNDEIYGMDGPDEIYGGPDDDDMLSGGLEGDLIVGDSFVGPLGSDGDDTLQGGDGQDDLFGYGGDDTLRVGPDLDTGEVATTPTPARRSRTRWAVDPTRSPRQSRGRHPAASGPWSTRRRRAMPSGAAPAKTGFVRALSTNAHQPSGDSVRLPRRTPRQVRRDVRFPRPRMRCGPAAGASSKRRSRMLTAAETTIQRVSATVHRAGSGGILYVPIGPTQVLAFASSTGVPPVVA